MSWKISWMLVYLFLVCICVSPSFKWSTYHFFNNCLFSHFESWLNINIIPTSTKPGLFIKHVNGYLQKIGSSLKYSTVPQHETVCLDSVLQVHLVSWKASLWQFVRLQLCPLIQSARNTLVAPVGQFIHHIILLLLCLFARFSYFHFKFMSYIFSWERLSIALCHT